VTRVSEKEIFKALREKCVGKERSGTARLKKKIAEKRGPLALYQLAGGQRVHVSRRRKKKDKRAANTNEKN